MALALATATAIASRAEQSDEKTCRAAVLPCCRAAVLPCCSRRPLADLWLVETDSSGCDAEADSWSRRFYPFRDRDGVGAIAVRGGMVSTYRVSRPSMPNIHRLRLRLPLPVHSSSSMVTPRVRSADIARESVLAGGLERVGVWPSVANPRSPLILLAIEILLHTALATWDLLFALGPPGPGSFAVEDSALGGSSPSSPP
jgi:hypothetical protein